MLLEICANSVTSAVNAQAGGADRVELCQNLTIGGTTPSATAIQMSRKLLTIDLYVLIRPRGGDFCYSDLEFDQILAAIALAKQWGANGIVTGILQSDGTVDVPRMQQVVRAAGNLPVTFHRAFDYTPDPYKALDTLIDLGCTHVLSAGQQADAYSGYTLLAKLVQRAQNNITVIPGGGITPSNIGWIAKLTKANSYHLSAKQLKQSYMATKHPQLSKTYPSLSYYETATNTVKAARKALDALISEGRVV